MNPADDSRADPGYAGRHSSATQHGGRHARERPVAPHPPASDRCEPAAPGSLSDAASLSAFVCAAGASAAHSTPRWWAVTGLNRRHQDFQAWTTRSASSFYVMLDVYSRYVGGGMIAHRESASLADTFIRRGASETLCPNRAIPGPLAPIRGHSHARRCDGFSLRDGPTRTSDIRIGRSWPKRRYRPYGARHASTEPTPSSD